MITTVVTGSRAKRERHPRLVKDDPQPEQGWGIICPGVSVAHWYRGGVPVCSQGRTRYLREGWYYHGDIKPTRGLKTDCKNCLKTLEKIGEIGGDTGPRPLGGPEGRADCRRRDRGRRAGVPDDLG